MTNSLNFSHLLVFLTKRQSFTYFHETFQFMELIVKKEQGLKEKTPWGVGRGFISRIFCITKTLTNATCFCVDSVTEKMHIN